MSLLLADGQLAAASATILGAGGGERIASIVLLNTSAIEQEIVLTLAREGGTARQFASATLKENESLYITGLPVDPSTVLAGYATGGGVVDYLVMSSPLAPFSVMTKAADGAQKQNAAVEISVSEKAALTYDGVAITGLLEQVRDLLLKIA